MQVSVETLDKLKRKVMVSIPTDKIEKEMSSRLRNLALKVKVDGFRPGKVPKSIVQSRYSDSVLREVAEEMVRSSLFNALEEKGLTPTGLPSVEFTQLEQGKDFQYTASFEVFPTIEIIELNQTPVELISAKVTDKDLEDMLLKLREKNKNWTEVSRDVKKEDKVFIDFKGLLDDKPFEGGNAENYELIIGSGAMIPGFEEGIIGAKQDQPFDIKVRFPENYDHKELAGKETVFHIVVKRVMEGTLPELDETFIKPFNIKEGTVEAFTKDIKDNMIRELERRVAMMNREKLFEKLTEANPVDLPEALVTREIEQMKHDLYHRLFGHEHKEDEVIPDFPKELFIKQAEQRVHLGLVFSEYVKKHEITPEEDKVNAMIDKFAAAYENPEELRSWYQSNQKNKEEIESLVVEELVAEKIAEDAKIKYIDMDFDSVMNSKRDNENEGE